MQSKACSKCNQVKPLSDFAPEKRSADGHRYACRACDRLKNLAYHHRNKDARNAAARERRRANPERDRGYSERYRSTFPWRMLLQHAKKRAAKFGWDYDLDSHTEQIKARLAPMKCEMTGIGLVSGVGAGGAGKRFHNTPSLDRINPTKGYTYDNIRIVCWAMNCALGTWGEETLRTVMTAWLKRE
jgi:hypothetical protein